MMTEERENFRVVRIQELDGTERERFVVFAGRNDAAHPPEQRRQIFLLILYVDCLVVIFRVNRYCDLKLLVIRFGKTSVTVRAPLHRFSDPIAIAQIEIIAHPDFIAVVNDRRAWQR